MKKFNFRKIGIFLAMIFVGGAALAGHVDAYTGNWTYDEGPTWKIGAYGEYLSNCPWGFIYAGICQSKAGPTNLELNLHLYGTDGPIGPSYLVCSYGTSLSSGLCGYYSDDETVDLHDYDPYVVNNGIVGSEYHMVVDYPDT